MPLVILWNKQMSRTPFAPWKTRRRKREPLARLLWLRWGTLEPSGGVRGPRCMPMGSGCASAAGPAKTTHDGRRWGMRRPRRDLETHARILRDNNSNDNNSTPTTSANTSTYPRLETSCYMLHTACYILHIAHHYNFNCPKGCGNPWSCCCVAFLSAFVTICVCGHVVCL